jgi:hypothetical protein
VPRVQDGPRNPYSPPSAPVGRPDRRDPAPRVVQLGAWLFGASYLLFYALRPEMRLVLKAVPVSDAQASEADFATGPSLPLLVLLGFVVAVTLFVAPFWFLFKAVKRRMWARLALTVTALLLVVLFLEGSRASSTGNPTQWALWLADVGLEFVAIALFFTPAANRWYREGRG